jgi:hexosaminidase
MKILMVAKSLVIIGLLVFSNGIFAQSKPKGIVPQPVMEQYSEGSFLLSQKTQIILPNENTDIWTMADILYKTIQKSLGFAPVITGSSASPDPSVFFLPADPADAKLLGNEGYRLEVDPQKIRIIANNKAGFFYGLQTLLQLIPPDKSRHPESFPAVREVPAVSILDFPRFPWRGLMLDVSRHFFTVKEVMKYIDDMAAYKFNVFHWHLSDDQGWRVEIKSLPKLTEIGAWRVPRTGIWWSFAPPEENEPATEGGFYTQDQIREVVEYAAERNITILPEIDVPGHSLAMIASYPELSSTGKKYPVNPGSKFYTIEDNSLCPGKEVVFDVLDKVFTEMATLFPGQYIHIGGDECNKSFWKNSAECQLLMKREGLKDLNELQSWFIKRLEKMLTAKGKKMIGWDEILEGGLAPEATVMSWRGMEGGIQAAKMGHHVVMSPTSNCYLDLYQGDPAVEPATYSMLRLSDVYRFEPVPVSVNPELILGGQGNLWTESIANLRHAQYMTWPRGMALAEILWSPVKGRDWNSFTDRLEYQFARLDDARINYSRSVYDPIIKMINDNGKIKISITTEIDKLSVHYSFDESFPDQFYPHYFTPLDIPKGASRIRAVAVKNGEVVSKMMSIDIAELTKRMKR